jgi:adenosylcobinamide-GDP ribazoletransferase
VIAMAAGLGGAMAFLTRLPVRRSWHPASTDDLARTIPWFPAVGLLVGAASALGYAALLPLVGPVPAATVAVAIGMIVTGGFHEDGLADCVDAFAGGNTVERRLEILKDSRHGTFGVLALVVSVVLRVALIASLDAWEAAGMICAAHALARGAAVLVMITRAGLTRPGLGSSYLEALGLGEAVAGLAMALVIGAVVAGPITLPAALLAAVAAQAVASWAIAKVGGISGDSLGAAEQLGEIAVLCVGVACVTNGWLDVPWWAP